MMLSVFFSLLAHAAAPCPARLEMEQELERLQQVRRELAESPSEGYATVDRDIELLARIQALTAKLQQQQGEGK